MRGAIFIRVLALAAIFVVLDLVYRFTMFPGDLRKNYPEALRIRETRSETDIYYFGESSNVTYAPYDTNKKSISDLVQDCVPGLRVTNINKYATHAGVYREWLRQLENDGKLPGAVIVTMNLRSFGAAWIHSDLETALTQPLVLGRGYPPLVSRFLLSLGALGHRTAEQRERDMLRSWRTDKLDFPFPFKYRTTHDWNAAMAAGGHLTADGKWDTPTIELACHYIKAYAFSIAENNPRLRDFDAIADWCQKKKVPLFFNLMAENVTAADTLVGKELVFLMAQNRDLLVKRYQSERCMVIDNLAAVPAASFIDKDWTTEHYDYAGRKIIARNLCDTLKNYLKQNVR